MEGNIANLCYTQHQRITHGSVVVSSINTEVCHAKSTLVPC